MNKLVLSIVILSALATGCKTKLFMRDVPEEEVTLQLPGVPYVAISVPGANSYLNLNTNNPITFGGTCTEIGRPVSVSVASGAFIATPNCVVGGFWTTAFNLSSLGQVPFSVTADHSTALGVSATTDSKNYTNDTIRPTVAISAPSVGTISSSGSTAYTLTFSDANLGVPAATTVNAAVTLSGTATGCTKATSCAANVCTVTFSTCSGSGTQTISMSSAAWSDLAFNTVVAAGPSAAFTVNNTNPTVLITSTNTSNPTTTLSAIPMTITFSAPVTGFVVGDITSTGGAISNFAGTGSTYTFDFSPTSNSTGTYTIDIAAGVAQDASSVLNTAATQYTKVFYTKTPTITGTTPTNDPTPSLTVGNIIASVQANIYSDAACTISKGSTTSAATTQVVTSSTISANTNFYADVTDAQGNKSSCSSVFALAFDDSQPTVVLTSTNTSNPTTTTGSVPMTATFSKSVTGFVVGDITVTGGSVSGFAGSGTTYTFNFTPSANTTGTFTIDVAANVAIDGFGNNNTAATQYTKVYYKKTPTITGTSPANSSTPSLTVGNIITTVSANIYSDAACSVSKGTIASTGTSQAVTSSSISANTAYYADVTDAQGNKSACSAVFNMVYDASQPSVSITSTNTSNPTTITSAIPMTVTFSESVTGFAVGDLSVSGGAVSGFAGSGSTYTFNFTPTAASTGTFTIDIAASAAQDSAGNNNTAATQYSKVYYLKTPTITGTTPTNNPMPSLSVGNIITSVNTNIYSDAACSVSKGTIVSTGTTQAVTSSAISANTDYYADVTDAQGNKSVCSSVFNLVFDNSAPSVVITSTNTSNPTAIVGTIPITVTFSASMTGFVVGDVSVSGGSISNFAGSGAVYTFDFTPTTNTTGTLTIDIAANVAQDASTNNNTAATQYTKVFYTKTPTITGTSPTGSATPSLTVGNIISTLNANIYSDASCSVSKGTIASAGTSQAVTSSAISASTNYYADVTDAQGNKSACSSVFAMVFDNSSPSVTITSTITSNPTTTTSAIPMTVTFSEVVTGFTSGDLSVAGGAISGFAGSGTTYTFNFTPTAASTGTLTIDIAASAAQDSAGNNSTAATQYSKVYYLKTPTITGTSPTNSATPSLTVGNIISGVNANIYSDSGCTVGKGGPVASSGTTQTVTSTTISANTNYYSDVTDAQGNKSACSAVFNMIYDASQPSVTITSTNTSNPTSTTSAIPMTVTFSESVTGFVVGDLTVAGGAVSGFAGSGTTYTFNFTPTAASTGTFTIDIAAGVAADSSSNSNTAATQYSKIFYTQTPTVTGTTPTNNTTPTLTVGNIITGLNANIYSDASCSTSKGTDVSVGATKTVVSSTISASTNYYADVTDAQGNKSACSAVFALVFSNTQPSVTITSTNTSNPTSSTAAIPMTVTFSAAVTGFVVGDLTVVGGGVSGFTGSGTTYTFNFTPTASSTGTFTIDIAAGVAQDGSSNLNTVATQYSKVFYTQTPTVTGTTPTSNTTPILTVGNIITGLNANIYSDASCSTSKGTAVSAGTTRAVTSSTISASTNYYADVTDAQGNKSACSSVFALTFDNSQPTVTITSTNTSNPTSTTSAIPMTVTFSESVTGFVAGDLTVTGGTVSGFAGSGTTYTFNFTPTANTTGTFTLDIAANAAQDASSNNSTAATQYSKVFYTQTPTVTGTTPTNNSTPTLTVGNIISGLNANIYSDASCSTGKGGPVASVGTTRTVTSSAISANTNYYSDVTDAQGNKSACSTVFALTFDNTQPTTTITSTNTANPTTQIVIPMKVTFSKAVTGFVIGDIVVAGGATSNFVAVDTQNYTFDFTPTTGATSGSMTVDVAAGVAADSSSNGNTVATQYTKTYYSKTPTLTGNTPTNDATPDLTVGNITNGSGYTANIYSGSTCAIGTIKGSQAAGGITEVVTSSTISATTDYYADLTDSAGNKSVCSSVRQIVYDGSTPTITLISPVNSSYVNIATHTSTFTASGLCSENGQTVTIKINGTARGTAACNGTSYASSNVDVSSYADAASLTFTASITNTAGTTATSSSTNIATVDLTAPSAAASGTLAWTESTPTNITTIHSSWVKSVSADVASQSVQYYTGLTCTATSGSAVSLAAATQTDTFGPVVAGTYSYKITSTDSAGNPTTSACSSGITVDTSAPTITLVSPVNSSYVNIATHTSSFTASGLCSENGQTVTIKINGTARGTAACNGTSYASTNVDVTSYADAASLTFTASITNTAGTTTTSASTNIATVDLTAPSISTVSTTSSGTYTTGGVINMTVNFNESVTVTGTVVIALNTTPARSSSCTNGTGTGLVCNYTVQANDAALRVDYVATNSLTGGTIVDIAGNPAVQTLPATGSNGLYSANIKINTLPAPTAIALQTPTAIYGKISQPTFLITHASLPSTVASVNVYSDATCTTLKGTLAATLNATSSSVQLTAALSNQTSPTTYYTAFVDSVGGKSACVGSQQYQYDNVTPLSIIGLGMDLPNNSVTYNHTIAFSGSGEGAAQVEIYPNSSCIAGEMLGSFTIGGSGNANPNADTAFSANITFSTDGTYHFHYLIHDISTNVITVCKDSGLDLTIETPDSVNSGNTAVAHTDHTTHEIKDYDNARKVIVIGGSTDGLVATNKTDVYTIGAPGVVGTWTAGPDLAGPRAKHSSVNLSDTQILIAGGVDENGNALYRTEVWEQNGVAGGHFVQTPPTLYPHVNGAMAVFSNGDVLFSGGLDPATGLPHNNSEILDHNTFNWSPLGVIAHAVQNLAATKLSDGTDTIVFSGGTNTGNLESDSTTLVKPSVINWGGYMIRPRTKHGSVELPDHSVFIAGGESSDMKSSEIYASGAWGPSGSHIDMQYSHTGGQKAMQISANGEKVYIAGAETSEMPRHSFLEFFNTTLRDWDATPKKLIEYRTKHTMTILSTGDILIVGGENGGGVLSKSELFTP